MSEIVENIVIKTWEKVDLKGKTKNEIIHEYELLERFVYEQQVEFNKLLSLLGHLEEVNRLQRGALHGVKADKPNIKSDNKPSENDLNEAENVSENNAGRPKGSKNFVASNLEDNVSETIVVNPDNYEEIINDPDVIKVGDSISYKIIYIPGHYKVLKYVCPKFMNKKDGSFFQAVKSDDVFPHSICTPELVVNTCTNKFLYGIPYYRQTETFLDTTINISRQDLCNYQIRATEILKPMYYYLKKKLLDTNCKVIQADETTHQVIKSGKKKCYLWVYCTTYFDKPIYIYEHCKSRSKENVSNFLNGFQGYLVTDAYAGYNNLNNIKNCYCWAHAQRNFTEILKNLKQSQANESASKKVVDLMKILFDKEKEFREEHLTPSEIKERRNSEDYLKDLNAVFDFLKSLNPAKGSKLAEAVNYILTREDGFKTYLEDGHIEMTNNISERAIKPFVIARKNFIFSYTENGASSSSIFFSLQQTCRANGINPEKYLVHLLKTIGSNPSEEVLESLLPRKMKSSFSLFPDNIAK